jgi:flagellar protein FlaF
MGFSVSASFVLILLGVFIAASAVYTTGGNTFERLNDARHDQAENLDAAHKTELNITSVGLTGTNDDCDVSFTVNNTGSTTLSLDETSLLIGNNYQTGWQGDATVDTDSATDLWSPGEQLGGERTGLFSPDAVTVVTKTGVSDRFDLGDRSCG